MRKAAKAAELDLCDRIALGTADFADKIIFLALELDEMIEDVVAWLLELGEDMKVFEFEAFDDITEALTLTKRRYGSRKIGGGYCKSDIPNADRHTIEARRGNGWKVLGRERQSRVASA
jgi:hypothetical protein